jgi:hypothetical protein
MGDPIVARVETDLDATIGGGFVSHDDVLVHPIVVGTDLENHSPEPTQELVVLDPISIGGKQPYSGADIVVKNRMMNQVVFAEDLDTSELHGDTTSARLNTHTQILIRRERHRQGAWEPRGVEALNRSRTFSPAGLALRP